MFNHSTNAALLFSVLVAALVFLLSLAGVPAALSAISTGRSRPTLRRWRSMPTGPQMRIACMRAMRGSGATKTPSRPDSKGTPTITTPK